MNEHNSAEMVELPRRQDASIAPRWPAALLVYVHIPAGLMLFVRPLLMANATVGNAFLWGVMSGIILYGVYDFTNIAVLQ